MSHLNLNTHYISRIILLLHVFLLQSDTRPYAIGLADKIKGEGAGVIRPHTSASRFEALRGEQTNGRTRNPLR